MLRLPPIQIGNKSVHLPISDRDAVSLIATLGEHDDSKRENRLLHRLVTCPSFFLSVIGQQDGQEPPNQWTGVCDLFLTFQQDWLAKWKNDAADIQCEFEPLMASTASLLKSLRKCLKTESETSGKKVLRAYVEFIVSTGLVGQKKATRWVEQNLSQFAFHDIHFLATEQLKKKEIVEQAGAWLYTGNITDHALRSLLSRLLTAPSGNEDAEARIFDEKLAAMKQLAYGASHEINNPLGNIASRAQMMAARESDAERKKQLSTIYQQAMRAHEMISDLMLFAHPPALDVQSFSLLDLLSELTNELTSNDNMQWQLPDDVELVGDKNQMASMLKALFQNSIEAAATRISIDCESQKSGLRISISDNGTGVSELAKKHLFDPFYSGREAGRGLGFGLSKAWRIAELHSGSLELESTQPGQTVFVIQLPNCNTAAPQD